MIKTIFYIFLSIIQIHIVSGQENLTQYVLVTGGAGYIGSHTCKALSQAGFIPVVYDDLSTGQESCVKWGPFERGDILDIKRLQEVLSKYNFIGILHFAAKISVPESITDPLSFYKHNFCGTLNVVESAKQYNIQALVFSSTCAVFGAINEPQAVHEDTVLGDLSSAYAQTKKDAESLLFWVHKAHHTPYACLRYFNVAGADPEGDLQAPKTYAIVPSILVAQQSNEPFKLYGTDYNTKDGTCVRDYIHVSDLADAHVKAMHYLLRKKQPLTLCLGSGKGYTNLEVLHMVEQVSGQTVPYENLPRRPGDLESIYADYTKAKELLGWAPTLSLEDIVRTAMRK